MSDECIHAYLVCRGAGVSLRELRETHTEDYIVGVEGMRRLRSRLREMGFEIESTFSSGVVAEAPKSLFEEVFDTKLEMGFKSLEWVKRPIIPQCLDGLVERVVFL